MNYIEKNIKNIPLIGIGTFPVRGKKLIHYINDSIKDGYTLFDTAYKYDNEQDIGDALKQHNLMLPSLIVQSKFCHKQYKGCLINGKYESGKFLSEYNYSCRLLNVDRINIYLLHGVFPGYIEAYRTMKQLYCTGNVDIIGICGAEKEILLKMKEKLGEYPMINQIEIHPYYNNNDLISFCQANGIIVEARSPFAHGDALKSLLKEPLLKRLASTYNKSIPQGNLY